MTLQESQMSLFEESDVRTLSVEDFRARLSALLESEQDLRILEGLYSLRLLGSHLFSDLNIYSLKTSQDSSTTTTEIHSRPSSERWMNWGMMRNGKCSTARILESPKTESGSYIIEGQQPKIIQRGHGYNQGGEHATAPTLTSNSWQENNLLAIKEATTKGYSEATVGDSINLSHPNSATRRGRVGKQMANTLLTGEEQGVVVYDFYNRNIKDEVGTLTASGHQGNTKAGTFGILDGIRIRKLTPRECWRLQGFPDWAFDRAQAVNSNSQLYKQAGNSVTVNVIEAIARKLEETDEQTGSD